MSKKCRIAIYLRLSKEDEDVRDESNSIINQRMMLREYVRKNFEQYELKEFADDGFSGVNFLRPGIKDMMDQVRNGEIDCIIVKDFSRFSRDYIELGSYLDQIFPFLGVRFVSINDNYDSLDHVGSTTELDTSFKGLLYDLYSKDLSVKVKSSLYTRKEQGEYVSGNTSFGYMRDPNDRHELMITEDEAKVVRRIFALALEGKTSSYIAKLFNQEKIPTPIEFQIKRGQTSRIPKGRRFQWNPSAICSILKNQAYAGDMVYDKYYKDEIGGKNHLKPRSEWKVYRNHHAAIISREDFEKIQNQRKKGGYKLPQNREHCHPLQGKVICSGCGKAMRLRKSGLNPYFSCKNRYVYMDVGNCVGNMNLMFLEQLVLCRIEAELSAQERLEQLKKEKEDELRGKLDALEIEREKLVKRKAVLLRKRLENYEKAVFEKEFQFQTDDSGINLVEKGLTDIDCEIDRLKANFSPKRKHEAIELFNRGYRGELSAELVEAFIEKIVVYDEKHFEIEWKRDAIV